MGASRRRKKLLRKIVAALPPPQVKPVLKPEMRAMLGEAFPDLSSEGTDTVFRIVTWARQMGITVSNPFNQQKPGVTLPPGLSAPGAQRKDEK